MSMPIAGFLFTSFLFGDLITLTSEQPVGDSLNGATSSVITPLMSTTGGSNIFLQVAFSGGTSFSSSATQGLVGVVGNSSNTLNGTETITFGFFSDSAATTPIQTTILSWQTGGTTLGNSDAFGISATDSAGAAVASASFEGMGNGTVPSGTWTAAVGDQFQAPLGISAAHQYVLSNTAGNGFRLNNFDIMGYKAIPEPSQYALMGLFALLVGCAKCFSKVSYSKE